MNLQTAFNTARSALLVNASQTATVSRNVSSASQQGYSRRLTLVETLSSGEVAVTGTDRAADQALLSGLLSAQSSSESDKAVEAALTTLQQTIGDPANAQSPAALIGALRTALTQAAASPQDASSLASAVEAARSVANALNSATNAVASVREQADSDMSASVATINNLLAKFDTANSAVVAGKLRGADVSDAMDQRDSIVSDLSKQIGVSTVIGKDGGMSIYTDSGATLYQGGPRAVAMSPTPVLTAGDSGAAVYVDGVPVTGASATMPIHSGALAGLAQVRDTLAPTYQTQLDEIARGLISATRQADQTSSSQPDRTGLFTWSGAPAVPGALTAGLAGQIKIDPSVDQTAGGNALLLRDGGIGASPS